MTALIHSSFLPSGIVQRVKKGCICSRSGMSETHSSADVMRVYAILAAYLIVCSVVLSFKAFQVRLYPTRKLRRVVGSRRSWRHSRHAP